MRNQEFYDVAKNFTNKISELNDVEIKKVEINKDEYAAVYKCPDINIHIFHYNGKNEQIEITIDDVYNIASLHVYKCENKIDVERKGWFNKNSDNKPYTAEQIKNELNYLYDYHSSIITPKTILNLDKESIVDSIEILLDNDFNARTDFNKLDQTLKEANISDLKLLKVQLERNVTLLALDKLRTNKLAQEVKSLLFQ